MSGTTDWNDYEWREAVARHQVETHSLIKLLVQGYPCALLRE